MTIRASGFWVKPSALLLVVALTLSCASWTPERKEKIGTIAGFVAGATIGVLVAGDPEVGLAIGGVVGALIGNRIGAFLDDRDQEMVAQMTEKALETGEEQTFTNEESGVSATIRVAKSEAIAGPVEIPVAPDRIAEMPPIEFLGDPYRAAKRINVRAGPSTDYEVVGSLAASEVVHVVGQVHGKSWLLIGQDGAASGYVYRPLLALVVEEPSEASPDVAAAPPLVVPDSTSSHAEAAPTSNPKTSDPEPAAASGTETTAPAVVEPEESAGDSPGWIASFLGPPAEPTPEPQPAEVPADAFPEVGITAPPKGAEATAAGTGGRSSEAQERPRATFMATSVCRTVVQEIKRADGKEIAQEVRACRGPNGWKKIDS